MTASIRSRQPRTVYPWTWYVPRRRLQRQQQQQRWEAPWYIERKLQCGWKRLPPHSALLNNQQVSFGNVGHLDVHIAEDLIALPAARRLASRLHPMMDHAPAGGPRGWGPH